uniref:RxLR effector protein n=1 Tax=Phytophthora agathidicida TaxID=1642459 RepID=A0A7G4WI36_9STRA|nr:PaRXLR47 [Phytophthora agathidicida]
MRLTYVVLLLAATLVSTSDGLTTAADSKKVEMLQETAAVRSLRTHHTVKITADTDDEERAIFTGLNGKLEKVENAIEMQNMAAHGGFKIQELGKVEDLVKNPTYAKWLKDGETPKTIYKLLEFEGKGPVVMKDPRYIEYLEFAKLWRAKKGTLAKESWQFWKKNAW